MPPSRSAPFLSIVLTGRNDAYGSDFVGRFLRTLEFNHGELRARGIDHEFVFVEWNPPANRVWLADVARRSIPALTEDVFAAYVVDPRYHETLRLNPRLEFLEFTAKNVGVRRARGQFILTTNCDVYLGRRILARLEAQALDSGTVYRALRVDIQMNTDQSRVDWELLEDPRNFVRAEKTLRPPLYGGGAGDFILLDRAGFAEMRGFNEVYRVARIGLDHNFLVKAYSNGYPIEDIGGSVYHVNHPGSFRITRRIYSGREHEAPYGDSRWHATKVTYFNPEQWGLADAPSRDLGGGRTWIEFDWRAVPPLVDLKRVVLPPARVGLPDL
jgi:hypothetical protein